MMEEHRKIFILRIKYLSRHQNRHAEIKARLWGIAPWCLKDNHQWEHMYVFTCICSTRCRSDIATFETYYYVNSQNPVMMYRHKGYAHAHTYWDILELPPYTIANMFCDSEYKIIALEHAKERAVCKIQRVVREWLDQPMWSNGKIGWGARESWKEIENVINLIAV